MKCNGNRNLMPLALEGTLKGDLDRSFHAHLEACAECRAKFLALSKVETQLDELGVEPCPELPADFESSVISAIRSPSRSQLANHVVWGLLIFAVVGFLLTLLPLFRTDILWQTRFFIDLCRLPVLESLFLTSSDKSFLIYSGAALLLWGGAFWSVYFMVFRSQRFSVQIG